MAGYSLEPVDYDPFAPKQAETKTPSYTLEPVDYDPFAPKKAAPAGRATMHGVVKGDPIKDLGQGVKNLGSGFAQGVQKGAIGALQTPVDIARGLGVQGADKYAGRLAGKVAKLNGQEPEGSTAYNVGETAGQIATNPGTYLGGVLSKKLPGGAVPGKRLTAMGGVGQAARLGGIFGAGSAPFEPTTNPKRGITDYLGGMIAGGGIGALAGGALGTLALGGKYLSELGGLSKKGAPPTLPEGVQKDIDFAKQSGIVPTGDIRGTQESLVNAGEQAKTGLTKTITGATPTKELDVARGETRNSFVNGVKSIAEDKNKRYAAAETEGALRELKFNPEPKRTTSGAKNLAPEDQFRKTFFTQKKEDKIKLSSSLEKRLQEGLNPKTPLTVKDLIDVDKELGRLKYKALGTESEKYADLQKTTREAIKEFSPQTDKLYTAARKVYEDYVEKLRVLRPLGLKDDTISSINKYINDAGTPEAKQFQKTLEKSIGSDLGEAHTKMGENLDLMDVLKDVLPKPKYDQLMAKSVDYEFSKAGYNPDKIAELKPYIDALVKTQGVKTDVVQEAYNKLMKTATWIKATGGASKIEPEFFKASTSYTKRLSNTIKAALGFAKNGVSNAFALSKGQAALEGSMGPREAALRELQSRINPNRVGFGQGLPNASGVVGGLGTQPVGGQRRQK